MVAPLDWGHGLSYLSTVAVDAIHRTMSVCDGLGVSDLEQQARVLLHTNWREGSYRGLDYGFSVPSPRSYPWQWYWDSCFHAIVRARWEPPRARQRARDAARRGAGRLHRAHDPVGAAAGPPAGRFATTSPRRRPDDEHDPAAGAGLGLVAGGRRSARGAAIARHHEWLRAHRDLGGDGLLWIIQPDESGMDASPKFDHVWGRYGRRGRRSSRADRPQPAHRLGRAPGRRAAVGVR